MIPTLEEFAQQEKPAETRPIEQWLDARGIREMVTTYLKDNHKPVATVHKYLVEFHGYASVWQTEKPIRELMNKVKRGNPIPA